MRLLLPLFAFLLSFLSVSAQTYSVSASAGACGSPSSSCQCEQNSSTTITDPDGAVRAEIRTFNSDQNVEFRFSKPPGGAQFFKCNARVRIYDSNDIDDPIVNEFVTLRCENDSQFSIQIPANFLPNSDGASKTFLVAFDNNPTNAGTDCLGNSCSSTSCALPLVSGQSNEQIVISSFEVTRDGSQNSGPDIAVTRVFLENILNPTAGADNRLEVELKNVSNFLLTGIEVEYTIDGEVVGDDSHSSMAPGAIVNESLGFTFDCPGTFEYCATVSIDQNDVNPSNNTLCRTVVVSALPPQITFTELRTLPESPVTTGEEVRLYVSLQNTGGLTAENVNVSFRINGSQIQSFNLGDLPAQSSERTRNVFYTFPDDGDYNFDAVVSYYNSCSESTDDETSPTLEIQVNDPAAPANFMASADDYFISEGPGVKTNTANVLVLHTANGRTAYTSGGSSLSLEDAIGQQIAATNLAFVNSNIDLELALTGIAPLNYNAESGNEGTMLIDALDLQNGVIDELQLLQEQYLADIIVIVSGVLMNSGGVACDISSKPELAPFRCGDINVAFVPGDLIDNIGNPSMFTGPRFVFAHEIAHLFGAGHISPDESQFPPPAKGHCNVGQGFRSVMTYRNACSGSVQLPVYSGPHDYPVAGTSVSAGDANRNNTVVITNNISTVVDHYDNGVTISNSGGQTLSISDVQSTSGSLTFNSTAVDIAPGETFTFLFYVDWNLVGTSTSTNITFSHNEGFDDVTLNLVPFSQSLANNSTFTANILASLVKNAEVSVIRNGYLELCGYTNFVGEIVCTTTPALKTGDQLQVSANGYETMTVTLTEDMINDGRLNLPVISDQSSSLLLNPYLEIVSDRFTSGSSVTVSAGASMNLTQTQVRSNGGGWQTISSGSSIALPLVDGSNTIEARLTGPGGNSIISEQVFKLPASEIVNATINVPAAFEGACFYASNLLITDLTAGSNSVNLPRTAINYIFRKKGYIDTKVELYAPTVPYNLSMSPRPDFDGSKTLSGFASQNVQFAERGVSLRYGGSSSLTITREDASFSDPNIIPLTQTVEVAKSGNDQLPVLLKVSYDQVQEFNINDASVLVEKNSEIREIIPAEFGDSIIIDDLNQVLTFTNLRGGERVTIIENASFLPVDLIYFTGLISAKGLSTLRWESANEEAFSHYELQHSVDASRFEAIGRVNGLGEGEYLANHNSVVGRNFYRLKMVDLDGTFQFSNIIQLNNDGSGLNPEINIYPNPANRVLNLLLPENVEIDAVSVVNADGRLVLKRESVGSSSLLLDISRLPAGIYFVRVNSGSTLYNNKFIKN